MCTIGGLGRHIGRQSTDISVDYRSTIGRDYSGTVHQETAIEGYDYCTFLQRAFELLISENYTYFILIISCNAVATHCYNNMGFKIFYSQEICMVEGSLKAHVFFSK